MASFVILTGKVRVRVRRADIDENVGGYDSMFEGMREPLASLEETIEVNRLHSIQWNPAPLSSEGGTTDKVLKTLT